jgi:hypothetical protein
MTRGRKLTPHQAWERAVAEMNHREFKKAQKIPKFTKVRVKAGVFSPEPLEPMYGQVMAHQRSGKYRVLLDGGYEWSLARDQFEVVK